MPLRFPLFALLALAFGAEALEPTELPLGPFTFVQTLAQVPVRHNVTGGLKLYSTAEGLQLSGVIDDDLSDLQAQFGELVGALALPKDRCAKTNHANVVIPSIQRRSLSAKGNTAILNITLDMELWFCPGGVLEFLGTHQLAATPLTIELPLTIVARDGIKLELQYGEPKVTPERLALEFGVVPLGEVDLKQEVKAALAKQLPLDRRTFTLPREYWIYNPRIESAELAARGEALSLKLALSARLPLGQLTELLRRTFMSSESVAPAAATSAK